MRFSRVFFIVTYSCAILFMFFSWAIPLCNNYISADKLIYSEQSTFGNYIKTEYNENEQKVDFILMDSIKMGSVNVVNSPQYVYLGGETLGFSYHGNGVLVLNTSNKNSDLQSGDVIIAINDEPIDGIKKIKSILNDKENVNKDLLVKIIRKNQEGIKTIKPSYDVLTKSYKLNIWAREGLSGIGTLTFVKEDGRFGALGHPILDVNTGTVLGVAYGDVYQCAVLGVKRATRGEPGELKGVFLKSNSDVGTVDKNCNSGIYGELNLNSKMMQNKTLVEVGGRLTAKPGKAYIYSSIDGVNKKEYQIEIIKTNYTSSGNSKNLIFKVTDETLIKSIGGIVQGMSGSPIIQNGKLIGAVTHVFVNDPTKGFGIYIDEMINN